MWFLLYQFVNEGSEETIHPGEPRAGVHGEVVLVEALVKEAGACVCVCEKERE